MVSCQESAFDRVFDRKLSILLSRRNELPTGNFRAIVFLRDDDTDLENLHEILGIDIPSGDTGGAGV
jgi:hypothetical protein